MDEDNRHKLKADQFANQFKIKSRKVVRLSQESLVKTDYLDGEKRFPLVLEPQADGLGRSQS